MANSSNIVHLGVHQEHADAWHMPAIKPRENPLSTIGRIGPNDSGYGNNYTDAIREQLSGEEGLVMDTLIVSVYFVCRLVESALAVLGNCLTIAIVARMKEMKTNTNLLIVSLALGDLLSGLDTPFYLIAELNKDNPTGHVFCLLAEFIDLLGGFGNTFSIACIALDRFLAVVYPMWYNRTHTLHNTLFMLGLMWLYIAFFLSSLFVFGQEDYKYPLCFFKSNLSAWAHDVVIYGHVALLTLFTCLCYGKVWCKLRRRHFFMQPRACLLIRRRHLRGKRLLGFVLLAYFALATPITVASFTGLLSAEMAPWQNAVFRFCWAVWYMNSFVNPILYVWFNGCFRRTIQRAVGLKWPARKGAKEGTGQTPPKPLDIIVCVSSDTARNLELVDKESTV